MPEAARLPADADGAPPITFTLDGRPVCARRGETLAAALLAAGVSTLRRSPQGEPRLTFCNMGTCLECVVRVDGAVVRTCLTLAADGMAVASWEAP